MASKHGFVGIFRYLDDLLRAIDRIKESQLSIHTVFSPTASSVIQKALESKPTRVRYFTLVGGVLGGFSGYALSAYTALQWHLVISGKPVLGWVSFTVVGYEFTVLGAVLFTMLGMLVTSRIPRLRIPDYYDSRFGEDHYGILIFCSGDNRDKVSSLLKEAGATEINEIE